MHRTAFSSLHQQVVAKLEGRQSPHSQDGCTCGKMQRCRRNQYTVTPLVAIYLDPWKVLMLTLQQLVVAVAVQGNLLEGPGGTMWHWEPAVAAPALLAVGSRPEEDLAGPVLLSGHLGGCWTGAARQGTVQALSAPARDVASLLRTQLPERAGAQHRQLMI